jgi:acyl-CoA reductase-like NAD-dependent aldehyde dehydrogenase
MAPSKSTSVNFHIFSNIVDGRHRDAKTEYNGIDPTTKEKLRDIPVASRDDVEDAVNAANSAYRDWSKKSWEERQEAITRFKEVYSSYLDELTEILVKETGKPKQYARGEVEVLSVLPIGTSSSQNPCWRNLMMRRRKSEQDMCRLM